MTSFLGELRRRNVVKVAVAYAIVGWVLIEVSTTVLPVFEAPDWIAQVFTFFIILGFPVALILSWAYEITPEGIKLERDVAAGESITRVTGRKLDFAIIGALVLALGFVVYNYVLQDGADQSPEVAVVEPEKAVLPNSVAVLPFENLSLDPQDAFFAIGIHDTILNELAKLRNMNVIARTSVLRYADGQTPISEIAEELNVETVMEGSVQYADGRILVTAQLIDPETNAHLWSDSYNREFSDIFAIQADIAMNIANALEAEFSLEEQARMAASSSVSPEATALYFKAFTVSNIAGILDPGGARRGTPFVDEALRLDPGFAQAHALKAEFLANRGQDVEAIEAANRALNLVPDLPEAYVAIGRAHMRRWRGAEAQAAYERALELSPKSVRFVLEYSRFNSFLDRHEAAVDLAERAIELDPNSLYAYMYLLVAHAFAGNAEAARDVALTLRKVAPEEPISYRYSGHVEIMLGNLDQALSFLRLAERLGTGSVAGEANRLAYAFSLGGFYDDALRVLTSGDPDRRDVETRLAVGDQAGALARLRADVENEERASLPLMRVKANIWQYPILDQPEFVELRNRLGFTDF